MDSNSLSFNDVLKEVYAILSFADENMVSKIPDDIFQDIITNAAMSDYEPKIDMNKSLDEQDISNESKSFLTALWYKYMADDDEKSDIAKIWSSN